MRRLLPESRFVRRIAMLSGGTLLGQLVLAGSSPVLTRLYGPAAFGGLAVFMSLWSILVVMAACRYEFAVPVVPDERDAAGLVGVGGVAAAATAGPATSGWSGDEPPAAL
jgi:O-antigen/teichoic acid export membrane protein